MKQCPHCAQAVANAAAVCPHCRSVIEPRDDAVRRAMASAAPAGADHSTYVVIGGLTMTLGLLVAVNADDGGFATAGLFVAILGAAILLVGIVALGILVGLRTRDRETVPQEERAPEVE